VKDWQLDLIRANDAEAEWERLNAKDPDKDKLVESASRLSCAYSCMGDVLDWIESAAQKLDGTPMEPKVRSLLDSLEKLNDEIYSLKSLYAEGRRE
jgi:hypothetical protein